MTLEGFNRLYFLVLSLDPAATKGSGHFLSLAAMSLQPFRKRVWFRALVRARLHVDIEKPLIELKRRGQFEHDLLELRVFRIQQIVVF